MTNDVLADIDSPFGKRVRRRLADDMVVWLATIAADGTPQPNPVWFLAEDDGILVYSRADAYRLGHIRRNPRVSLNFDSDGAGGDIVVMSGAAKIVGGHPLAHEYPAYIRKYEASARHISGDVEAFSLAYPVALKVRIDRVRGF